MRLKFKVEFNCEMKFRLREVSKIIFLMIRKTLKFNGKPIEGLVETIKHVKRAKNPSRIARVSFGLQEYEFSCKNSPNPVMFEMAKNRRQCLPCIRLPSVMEEYEEEYEFYGGKTPEEVISLMCTPECTLFRFDRRSPLFSPFSVRVSNYSSEDEGDEKCVQVDHKAEEFIRRFYDQLKKQILH